MKSLWHEERGVTLIELMAGLAVGLIVVAAGFTALTSSDKATRANDQVAQTQQSARIAMELLSNDLKMAGFGMILGQQVGGCTSAIMPGDNTQAGPDLGSDSISIAAPVTASSAPFWTLSITTPTSPFTQITLQAGAVAAMVAQGLAVGGTVSVGGAKSVRVNSFDAGTDTISFTPAMPSPVTFAGCNQAAVGCINPTPVYLLQCITYQVIRATDPNAAACAGGAPCLVRGVAAGNNCNVLPNTCVDVADGIEDVQVAYACDGCVPTVNGGAEDRIIDDQTGGVLNEFDCYDFLPNNHTTCPGGAPGPSSGVLPSGANPNTIRMVRITIVARQNTNAITGTTFEQGLGEGQVTPTNTQGPIIAEDHNPSSDAGYNAVIYSQFRRRTLTRTVELRNIGLIGS
jgi:type IV pilus assembly protein PilW